MTSVQLQINHESLLKERQNLVLSVMTSNLSLIVRTSYRLLVNRETILIEIIAKTNYIGVKHSTLKRLLTSIHKGDVSTENTLQRYCTDYGLISTVK